MTARSTAPLNEPDELRRLQLEHLKRIIDSDRIRMQFHSLGHLTDQVRVMRFDAESLAQGVTSRLAVLMFAELIDAEAVRERRGELVWLRDVVRPFHDLLQESLTCWGGKVRRETSNEYEINFETADAATKAALALHQAVRRHGWRGPRPGLRVGIHVGQIIQFGGVDESRFLQASHAVDECRQLTRLAVAGQTLMTRTAFDVAREQVRQDPSLGENGGVGVLEWQFHGRYYLPDTEEMLDVYEVGVVDLSPLAAPPDSPRAWRVDSFKRQDIPPGAPPSAEISLAGQARTSIARWARAAPARSESRGRSGRYSSPTGVRIRPAWPDGSMTVCAAHFGEDSVFMDIDSIPVGLDFREHITSAVNQCGILLAVIGRNWVGEIGSRRRIDDPRDFIRIQIESAPGAEPPSGPDSNRPCQDARRDRLAAVASPIGVPQRARFGSGPRLPFSHRPPHQRYRTPAWRPKHAAVAAVRRGSPDPADRPDRRSPVFVVGSDFQSVGACEHTPKEGDLRSGSRRGQETTAVNFLGLQTPWKPGVSGRFRRHPWGHRPSGSTPATPGRAAEDPGWLGSSRLRRAAPRGLRRPRCTQQWSGDPRRTTSVPLAGTGRLTMTMPSDPGSEHLEPPLNPIVLGVSGHGDPRPGD